MGKRTSLTSRLAAEYKSIQTELHRPSYPLASFTSAQTDSFPYPIDMSPLLAFPFGGLDANGVLFNERNGAFGSAYQPTSIAQFALAQWNAYLVDHDRSRLDSFLIQARWLLEHETRFTNGTSVWPIPYPVPAYGAARPWLSALTQGNVLSVLARAYKATSDTQYLECAQRCVRSFQFDILDGGVSAPVANGGIFFEEVATYPAGRILNGYILSVLGIYDYLYVTDDPQIQRLAEWSVETLHELLPGYELGYWSSYDLIYNRPAPRFYHLLHVSLLQALALQTGCQHCRDLADRWAAYDRPPFARLRYFTVSRLRRYASKLSRQKSSIQRQGTVAKIRALAGITGSPIAGGMRSAATHTSKASGADWLSEQNDRQALRERLGLRRDALVVALPHHSMNEKELEVAIKAIERARSSVPLDVATRLLVIVAGSGPLPRTLERNIREHNLDRAVLLKGKATAEEITDYLKCSDIFFYTGRSGSAFLQTAPAAMDAGCAVVATTSTMGSRMLLDERRGIAIPSGNVNALSAALEYLLANPDARDQMRACAWHYIKEQSSAEALRRAELRSTGWIPDVDVWIEK